MNRLAVVLVLIAAPAFAQSTRYPPEPVDKDAEAAAKSKLWDKAINPHKQPYEARIAEAKQLIAARTDDDLVEAVHKLDQAIVLQPNQPTAYQIRGEAYLGLRDWAKCAADFQAAAAKQRRDADRKATADLRRNLGLCQARNGKLADAESTFADVAASGLGTGEVLMRLGEVRIAMGKLDEAIATLSAAVDTTEYTAQASIRWLLALAYDRARRPAEAIEQVRRAAGYDRSLNWLKSASTSALPFIGTGEPEYLLGLAYAYNEPPRSELALAYFRRFVQLAPDSPWKRRAEEHLKEIKPSELPEAVERQGGNAALEVEAARTVVRKQMPAMRACAAKTPNTIYSVSIMKVGPRTPVSTKYRPRYLPPPEGVAVRIEETLEAAPRADTDAAIRCIQPLAEHLVMPAIKEKDAYYKVGFLVVGP